MQFWKKRFPPRNKLLGGYAEAIIARVVDFPIGFRTGVIAADFDHVGTGGQSSSDQLRLAIQSSIRPFNKPPVLIHEKNIEIVCVAVVPRSQSEDIQPNC